MLGQLVEDAFALDEVAGDVEGVVEPRRLAAVDLEVGDSRRPARSGAGRAGR